MKTRGFAQMLAAAALVCMMASSSHAQQDADAGTERQFKVEPIGVVQKEDGRTTLVLREEFAPGLLGLDGFSHVWVLWWFDRNDTPEKRSVLQVHPRGNPENPLTGVFACRSPMRPNLLAQTLCRVIAVCDNVVEIETIDAFANTPILDLKPYIPRTDSADATLPAWIRMP
jgi:tRNA-Thr(GGU) m(6)t(6)A37 methyltransferase TsaA